MTFRLLTDSLSFFEIVKPIQCLARYIRSVRFIWLFCHQSSLKTCSTWGLVSRILSSMVNHNLRFFYFFWYHWKVKNIPNNARGTVVENKPSISYKTKRKWIRFIIFCETNDRDTKSIKQKLAFHVVNVQKRGEKCMVSDERDAVRYILYLTVELYGSSKKTIQLEIMSWILLGKVWCYY